MVAERHQISASAIARVQYMFALVMAILRRKGTSQAEKLLCLAKPPFIVFAWALPSLAKHNPNLLLLHLP